MEENEKPGDDILITRGRIRMTILILAGIAGLALTLTMMSGFHLVKQGEAAALQTFGAARPEPVTQEGLHWHWPPPIGDQKSIQVSKSRTAEIGFQTLRDGRIDLLTGENWQRDHNASTWPSTKSAA